MNSWNSSFMIIDLLSGSTKTISTQVKVTFPLFHFLKNYLEKNEEICHFFTHPNTTKTLEKTRIQSNGLEKFASKTSALRNRRLRTYQNFHLPQTVLITEVQSCY